MLTSQKVIDAINSDSRREQASPPSTTLRRGRQIGYEFSAELQYYAIGAHFAAEALPQLPQHFSSEPSR
jgi:hypothetical protein